MIKKQTNHDNVEEPGALSYMFIFNQEYGEADILVTNLHERAKLQHYVRIE
jgi:hypothetical protein